MKRIVIAATGGFAKEILTILHDLGNIDLFDGFIDPDNFFDKKKDTRKIIGFPILNSSQVKPDTPFGGGSGMLLKADVLAKSIDQNKKKGERIFYLSPNKNQRELFHARFLFPGCLCC